MQLLITKFPPLSCHFLSLRSVLAVTHIQKRYSVRTIGYVPQPHKTFTVTVLYRRLPTWVRSWNWQFQELAAGWLRVTPALL